ncbi:MAG: hypothetical protein QOH47_991 [Sphingomonadales bacterium]|nr:hypothetical protein [Sphingomonadales bacterium]
MYTTIDGYQRLLAGAQNRPSSRVRHPLLVWHVGLWHLPEPEAEETDEGTETEAETKPSPGGEERFAAYVREIAKRIKAKDPSASVSLFEPCLTSYEKDPGAEDHPGLVVMEFDWYFFKATLRFEQHTEYCTVTALLDLSSEKGRPAYCDKGTPKKLCAIIDEIDTLEGMREVDAETRYGVGFRDQFSGISEAAFLTVWEEFYNSVLFTSAPEVDALGGVFADFRGIVLSDQVEAKGTEAQCGEADSEGAETPGDDASVEGAASSGAEAGAEETDTPAEAAGSDKTEPLTLFGIRIQPAFWRKEKVRRRVVSRAPDPLESYWKERYDLLWPLMTAKMGEIDFLNYEFTASMMSEGRALYLSALGAQPVKRETSEERIPLCYGLYTHQLGGWAIGRLIEQINQQGTLRLASLIDLPALQSASAPLREAEDEVRTSFTSRIKVDGEEEARQQEGQQKGRRREDKEKDPYSERRIGELKACLDRTQDLLGKADSKVTGGVAHRIERSRYYIRRFREGLPALQIKQFGDMQPYNVFVERRLGPTFGYIDMLWSRYDRVRRDMRALYQRLLAEETKNVATAIRDRNTETEWLHQSADLFFFWLLGPYYFCLVFTHLAFPNHEHGMPNGYWLVFWLIFLAIGFSRPSLRFLPQRRLLSVVLLGMSLGLAIGMVAEGTWEIHVPIPDDLTLERNQASGTGRGVDEGAEQSAGRAAVAASNQAKSITSVQAESLQNSQASQPRPQRR